MSAIAWRHVGLVAGRRRILDDICLDAGRGEVLGIVGPNGAGKTALLRSAAGLVRDVTGEVELGGAASRGLVAAERARLMAYLPQAAEAAWPISVESAVALGRIAHRQRADAAADAAAVATALARTGIADLARRRLDTLSGGERALALLARALAVEAPVLLLDEPCAALDPRHQIAAMTLFRRLAADGICVCVVLHDLSLAARFCDRVAVLDRGRLIASGPPASVLDEALLSGVYGITGLRVATGGGMLLVPWALAQDAGGELGR